MAPPRQFSICVLKPDILTEKLPKMVDLEHIVNVFGEISRPENFIARVTGEKGIRKATGEGR